MEKECQICGGLFYTENKNRKYCDDCAAHTQTRVNEIERAQRRACLITKEARLFNGKCDQCGKEFKTPKHLLFSQRDSTTGKQVIFCSRKCRKTWLHTHDVCDYCGKPLKEDYYTIPELIGSKFCSSRCSSYYLRSQKIRIEVLRECEFCGKKYVGDNERFCSDSCYKNSKKRGVNLEHNHNKTPKKEIKFFRRQEFCECCGKEMTKFYRLPIPCDFVFPRHTCSPECQATVEERKKKSSPDSEAQDKEREAIAHEVHTS